jgi:hypothetical protein
LKPSKEQLEKVYGGIMKEANDLRLQVASENTLSATDRQSKTFNNGPEGRQLIMPHNERPAEPLFCLDLSRL